MIAKADDDETTAPPGCADCVFWFGTTPRYGLCQRHAPVIFPPVLTARWPITCGGDYCGDFLAGTHPLADGYE